MNSRIVLMASSISHARPLTYAGGGGAKSASLLNHTRLVPQPPDLIKWVKREGGFVHKAVKISQLEQSDGLCLAATEEIPEGSDIVILPHHITLQFGTSEEAVRENGAHSALVRLAQHVPEELWAMKLGLKLLQERAKKGSFWWPYISNLPETYSVPIFFPGEDIKNLQYAPLLHQVNKRCHFLLDFDKVVKSELENLKSKDHPFEGQTVDASSLGWAMSAVSSRAFRLHGNMHPDGTHADVPMMLPLIDMCNHSFNPNAKIVQEQDASSGRMLVKVIAGSQIKQDHPLLLNYGNFNNDLFLLDYGFVVASNPYDCVELKYDPGLLDAASMAAGITSPTFSSPAAWQQQILSQLNLDKEDSHLKVTLGGPELVEGRLLAALRVFLSNDKAAVEKTNLDTLKSLSFEAPLGLSTEIAAFRTIIALCVIALGHFPTKIMEDEALLKQNVSTSTELAVQFRIQKKSLIIDAMRDLTKRVKLLSSKESLTS